MDTTVLDGFADLLAYPLAGHPERVEAIYAGMKIEDADAAASLEPLRAWCAEKGQGEIEEAYTRSFDMNPSCALELGWHLYGEDYDRGAFLVTVRELMRLHGVEEAGELPDHITHILRLVGRLDEEEAGRFSRRQALPAVERILGNMKDEEHPFRALIAGVRDALEARFGPADSVPASAFACPAPYEEAPSSCGGATGCSGMPMPPRGPQSDPSEM